MPVITNQEMKMNADSLLGTTGLTEGRIFAILHSIPAFHAAKGDSEVKALKALCISEGKGFLSQVFKVVASFEDARRPAYSFILKLPIAAGLQQVIEKGKANGEENVVDQIVVDGHSNEVDFYTLANRIKGLPIAEAYAFEKIVPGQSNGLLAMQDLSELGEPLGFYRTANAAQTKSVAESIAKLQFWAENQPEFERWMRTLRVSIHLEEIITKYTSDEVMQELVNIPQIHAFLPKIKVVFDQAFSYFCLLDRPKELNGLAFCHGDTQPNNIIFKHGEKRELTAEVAAFIDWQLVFNGNALFDLARFLTFSVNGEVREEADRKAFAAYYLKLVLLHKKKGTKPPFTYEQGLELFELALCQQLGFIVVFLGIFSMACKQEGRAVPADFPLVPRALFCIKKAIGIIEKRNLNTFNTRSSL